MNGQWPGPPPPQQHQRYQQQQQMQHQQQHMQQIHQMQQQQQQQQQQQHGGGGAAGGAAAAAAAGNDAATLPSSEALEVEAMKRGMPSLEQCLRRCPRCLEGVPIRSMMCQHCQYLIPVSAKAIARREMKEAAAVQQPPISGMMNGGAAGGAGGGEGGYEGSDYSSRAPPPPSRPKGEASGATGAGAGAASPAAPGGAPGHAGGDNSDSDERPRQKRKRQSTKKGMMTATAEELAELDEGLSEDEPVSWRKSSAQRRTGRVQIDKRKKKCPSCNEMNPMSVKVCRECDTVFPVGARLDSAVTSEELREKFNFEPEFNKDGTPMIEKILGRRPLKEPDPDDKDTMSVLKKHHRAAHYGHYYECMVKFKGVAYNKVEWMSDLEIRSLGMVASRMLTNYIKTKERDDQGRPTEVEDDEYFDPSYLEVEKVLDAKWFKMELERYPDGFDPNAPGDKDEEEDEVDEDDLPDEPAGERAPPPEWEDDGVAMVSGRRTKEEAEWRPMTRCRHVLSTMMEDDLSVVFHEPVDVDAYPSYAEKVDEPMDFGTIKDKLDNWEYRRNDPVGFQRDVRLVFTNCKVFNKFGSAIWYIADYLQAKFERLFQAWVMNFGDKDDRIPWEEPRARPWEEWCRKCLGPELKSNKMLICDTCDAEYHCNCLGLPAVPEGQWLCPICTVSLHKGQTLFSHQTEVEKAKRSQMPQPTMDVVDVQKYLVKWSGLSYQFCTWETREELNNDTVIDNFHKLNDHPPVSPPMSQEELVRTLSQTNHDVLPALLEPSSVLEFNAQIYSQIRAFHFLRHGLSPPTGLLKECGKPAAILSEQREAPAKTPVDAPPSKAKDEEEIVSLLFDMKQSMAHGKKYEAPPRADMPALPMHQYEYEVTLPKEHGSLFMNIHQQTCDGIICVSVSTLLPRMPPRQHEPTPVMRSHMVAVGDVITAINGMPMLGFDTSVVATVLQDLPACVTLRLVKYGFDYIPAVAQTQARYSEELATGNYKTKRTDGASQGLRAEYSNATAEGQEKSKWRNHIKPVDDEFTRSDAAVGVGEASMIEAEHRVIEELGQKRRLLMAANESQKKPTSSDWADVEKVYSLSDYVYAHENMGHVESMASRRHDPRAKPIEQLDAETGEVLKVWPSMTAASVATGIGVSALSACVNGITAQAGRWKWRFASKHTATTLKMGVYRKNRVADMSGGPGAYLEPEAAAAQIASGRRADYDSDHDHGFGDAIDTKKPSASSSASAIGAAAAKAAEASSATPGAEDPAQAEMANGKTPAAPSDQVSADPKTGSPALAAMDVDTEGRIPGDNAESRAGLKRDTEGGGDIDVDDDIDANAGGGRDERMSDNGESQMRQQMEQARRQREAERDGEGGRGYPDGDRSGGMQGYADEYEKMRAASGYGGNDDDGYNCDGDNAGRGKPHEDSESKPRGAKSDKSSDDEEEVDWEDSAEEDMDAATAEAMEQARIGMARAAARDLRESRATRAQMMEWPYKESKDKDGPTQDFKNGNELRDYQRRGVNWMVSCWKKKRRGCILADEMGLGKTVQVVATLNYVFSSSEREKGPFLVVVPLTTIEHWRREVEAWTEMNLCMYHDNGGRDMRDLIREYEWYYAGRSKRVLKFHVLVTTYDDVISDAEMLAQVPWRAVVVDEAHRMRNKNSALLGCLQQVVHNGMTIHPYQHRVLMTGTPMQNIKEELWPLMNFVDQGNFPDLQRFQDKYCKGEPGHEVDEARALRRRLKPYMLRRRKEDVTKDIPPKEETIIDVELTMVQKKYYRAIYERNHSVLNKVGAGAGKAPSLMNIQMELRKCCNHPFMVRGVEDHEVDQIVGNMMDEAQDQDPSKLDEQHKNQMRLEKGLIHTSGKMILLDKLLPKLKSEGHKVLIFSQFIGMLDMVQEFLVLRGHRHERLDGRTTGNERQKSIDRFNRDPTSFVFLLSTRAGGVGINLTAADTCIIYDSDWNPQNDVQAMARCHRIGQTKSVMVYRLITRNCFESEMFNRASMKLGLEQAVLGDAAGSLKPRDMEDLLKKGAYALTQMDEVDAMREFQAMDIDSILVKKSRVLVEELTAKGIADDSDHDDESDKDEGHNAHRGDQHRVTWRSFGGGAKTGPSLEDPDFWRKVMPDVMTPESMVSKLDAFESLKEGDDETSQEDLDAFMKDLGVMVVGLRKSSDEDEREKGVQLLVRVTCKREMFSEAQCDKAKRWELELQGTRLRQAARQDVGDGTIVDQSSGPRGKGRGGRRGSGMYAKDDDYDGGGGPKAKISGTPGGGGGGTGGKSGGKGGSGRDHNMDMCARCEDGGVIMMCDGPCQRSFHPACLGMDDKPHEDPWMCNRCSSKVQKCLECGEKGPEMDSHNRAVKVPGGVSRCQLSSCGRFYHKDCLNKMKPNRTAYSKEGNFKCPQHFCIDCGKTSTNLGPRTLSKCLRCAKARCPECLTTARYVKKGKWMVCADHEWTPQDHALYEEQQRQKKHGLEKGKRKPKTPIPPSCQFTEEEGVKLEDGRAPVCYFCKRDVDDAKAVQGEFIRPPFVQKTIKHGEHPIWLHKNCALYTPECFVEYHEPSEAKASGNSKSSSPSSSSKGTSSASAKSVSGKAGGVKSEVSEKGDGSPSSKSSKGKLKGNDDGDGDTGGGKSERKAEYYGVDAARKRVALKCTSCALQGALIGCHVSSCQVNTHFACAVREGWKFGEPDADGKLFLCIMHRKQGQVRFERKAPAKKASKKAAPRTPGNKGSAGGGGAASSSSSSTSKGRSRTRDRASSIDDDSVAGDGPISSSSSSSRKPKVEDDDVSDEEIKTPKAKKAKRSGSGASVTVKPEGKGGREGPPRRVSKNGKPVVQCACGNVELEGEGYIQCEGCRAWLHLECAGVTPEDVANSRRPFFCEDCGDASDKSGGKPPKSRSKRKPSVGADEGKSNKKAKGGGGSGVSGGIKGKGKGGGGTGSGEGGVVREKGGGVSSQKESGGRREEERYEPWASLEEDWEELNTLQKKTVVMTALASLAKEDPLKYFADPVDISLVPGYRDVVSRPLDFSTIKKRQKKGHYAKLGVSKLWEDISTVYRNAQLYNQDESDCYKTAQKGLDIMKGRLEKATREAASSRSLNGSTVATIQKKSAKAAAREVGGAGARHKSRQGDVAPVEDEDDADDAAADDGDDHDDDDDDDYGEERGYRAPKQAVARRGRGQPHPTARQKDEDRDEEDEEEREEEDEEEEDEEEEEEDDDDSDYEDSSAAASRRRRSSRASPARSKPRGRGGAGVGSGRRADKGGMEEDGDDGSDGVPPPQPKRKRR